MESYSYFPDLAEISPNLPRYISSKEIAFDIEAIIGHGEVPLGEFVLGVKIRNCILQILTPNSVIQNGSRYEVKLQPFSFEQKKSNVKTIAKRARARGDITAEASVSWMPSFFGRLRVAGGAQIDGDALERIEQTRRPEVSLITPLPANKWLVGDTDLGDVRKPDGCLHGTYFQEARSEGLNELASVCSMSAKNVDAPIEISIALYVKTADFRFSLSDRWGNNARETKASEKEEFEKKMKAKVLGIALTNKLRDAQRRILSSLQENDVLVCVGTIHQTDFVPLEEGGHA